jgi:hypothetical protein
VAQLNQQGGLPNAIGAAACCGVGATLHSTADIMHSHTNREVQARGAEHRRYTATFHVRGTGVIQGEIPDIVQLQNFSLY